MNNELLEKYNFYPEKDGLCDRFGNYMTNYLFLERASKTFLEAHNYDVPYTLKNKNICENNKVYYSLYLIYMEATDEYDFSIIAFGSYQQFKVLCELKWFMDGFKSFRGLKAWREEKEAMRRSINQKRLDAQAELGNMQAIKSIQESFEERGSKGRPSKEDKERHLKENKVVIDTIREMQKSISKSSSLKLVKGNAESKQADSTNIKSA